MCCDSQRQLQKPADGRDLSDVPGRRISPFLSMEMTRGRRNDDREEGASCALFCSLWDWPRGTVTSISLWEDTPPTESEDTEVRAGKRLV